MSEKHSADWTLDQLVDHMEKEHGGEWAPPFRVVPYETKTLGGTSYVSYRVMDANDQIAADIPNADKAAMEMIRLNEKYDPNAEHLPNTPHDDERQEAAEEIAEAHAEAAEETAEEAREEAAEVEEAISQVEAAIPDDMKPAIKAMILETLEERARAAETEAEMAAAEAEVAANADAAAEAAPDRETAEDAAVDAEIAADVAEGAAAEVVADTPPQVTHPWYRPRFQR